MPVVVPFDLTNMGYVIALGKELHDLGSFREVEFDYQHTMLSVIDVMTSHNRFGVIAKDDDNEWRGIMVGYVETFIFSPRLVANEGLLYVREGKSRAKIAMMLVRAFMKWAIEERGVTHIQSGDVASINPTAVDALYRRLGFKRFGVIYKFSPPGSVV